MSKLSTLVAVVLAIVLCSGCALAQPSDEISVEDRLKDQIVNATPLPRVKIEVPEGLGYNLFERMTAATEVELESEAQVQLAGQLNEGLADSNSIHSTGVPPEVMLVLAGDAMTVDVLSSVTIPAELSSSYGSLAFEDSFTPDNYYLGSALSYEPSRSAYAMDFERTRDSLEQIGCVAIIESADPQSVESTAFAVRLFKQYGVNCDINDWTGLSELQQRLADSELNGPSEVWAASTLAEAGFLEGDAIRDIVVERQWSTAEAVVLDTTNLALMMRTFVLLDLPTPNGWVDEMRRRAISDAGGVVPLSDSHILLDIADAFQILGADEAKRQLAAAIVRDELEPGDVIVAELIAGEAVSAKSLSGAFESSQLDPEVVWLALERGSLTCTDLQDLGEGMAELVEVGSAAENIYATAIGVQCFDRDGSPINIDAPSSKVWPVLLTQVRQYCAAVATGLVDEVPLSELPDDPAADDTDVESLAASVIVAQVSREGCTALEEL